MQTKRRLLFSTRRYDYLRQRVASAGEFELGRVERRTFPDGEHYQRILDDVDARKVVLVGGTVSDVDTLEVYDLASALVKYGAESLTLVVPYFGYSTMDRAVRHGDVVTAKTRARLLSSIPTPRHGFRIILLDPHAEGLTYYFEGAITPVCVSAREVIKRAARGLCADSFVLACTDAGRAKWVQSLADDMGVDASFVFKRRLNARRTELTAVSAHVEDQDVIIYDDMIRTGSSLITAARAYRDAGARTISAIATHGVFPGNALASLKESGLFRKIICTDSHPRAVELTGDFLEVLSVGELLAGAIERRLYATLTT
ncbi:MAG TPA: ribose-phosphate diphosphokinase [Candidatus Obscuribacterales bacterium]